MTRYYIQLEKREDTSWRWWVVDKDNEFRPGQYLATGFGSSPDLGFVTKWGAIWNAKRQLRRLERDRRARKTTFSEIVALDIK